MRSWRPSGSSGHLMSAQVSRQVMYSRKRHLLSFQMSVQQVSSLEAFSTVFEVALICIDRVMVCLVASERRQ